MLFDTQTVAPASSRSLAEFVAGPPAIRSSISTTVAQRAPNARTPTRTTESVRSARERRSIRPGSPAITATSSTPSTSGSSHAGPARTGAGNRIVSTIAATTAPAIGQRASPTTTLSLKVSGAPADVPPMCGSRANVIESVVEARASAASAASLAHEHRCGLAREADVVVAADVHGHPLEHAGVRRLPHRAPDLG